MWVSAVDSSAESPFLANFGGKNQTLFSGLDHPCIIKIKEVIEDSRFMVLVLEYAKGGELFDYVLADFHSLPAFDEKIAKLQFYQVRSLMKGYYPIQCLTAN